MTRQGQDTHVLLYAHLVLLESLAANVERQIVRVHHSSDESQVAGKQLVELVGDEHLAHVQLQSSLVVIWKIREGRVG